MKTSKVRRTKHGNKHVGGPCQAVSTEHGPFPFCTFRVFIYIHNGEHEDETQGPHDVVDAIVFVYGGCRPEGFVFVQFREQGE